MIATIPQIQDRLHAINQTLTSITSSRFYPQNFDSVKLPIIFSLPRQRRPSSLITTREGLYDDRTFELVVVVGTWLSSLPIKSIQLLGETIIDEVDILYSTRPRLELNNSPLAGVERTILTEDTGLQPERQQPDYAAIYFSLTVTVPNRRSQDCY